MKKTYVKPMILFEDFKVSSSIAAGCTYIANSTQENSCGCDIGGFNVFMVGLTGCNDYPVEEDGENKICYHVPFGNNVFSS